MSTLIARYSTRFHSTGMEDGPAKVLAELGGAAEDVPFDLGGAPPAALVDGLPRLAEAVESVAAGNQIPLALLAECTLVPAVVGGLRARYPSLALIWIDAHGDLNTPATTPSGFWGGMPFAVLLGWCHGDVRRAAGLEPPLAEARAALVGARDLDPGERDAIAVSALVVTDSVAEALSRLPAEAPLHVHLDGDVLDPHDAPGVDFPAPDGWSTARLLEEIEPLMSSGRVVGVSLCCGNPHRDPDGRGARAYADAIRRLVAARPSGSTPPRPAS